MIKYFEENLFICVQTLLIWSCDHGRIPLKKSCWSCWGIHVVIGWSSYDLHHVVIDFWRTTCVYVGGATYIALNVAEEDI